MIAAPEKEQNAMRFKRDGAQHYKAVLSPRASESIGNALSDLPQNKAGIRLKGVSALNSYLSVKGIIGKIAQSVLGANAKPVRAILFDKTPLTNWNLGWHQDRTIAVRQRKEIDGFGTWSMKAGMQYVEPPFELLARMLTLRVHLDEVSPDNAPLVIAPGAHRFGRVAEANIHGVVEKCGTFPCLADAGDIWLYATPILHSSKAAISPIHRRVLQVDYSADNLPSELDWLGI